MAEVLTVYNSLTRHRESLSNNGRNFGLYCCGPTVYNFAHVGNFRTFIIVDIVYRILKLLGQRPFYVRNITDVDDKTIAGAQKAGQSLRAFTAHWTDLFHADCRSLNLLPPDTEPRATAHIADQIGLIGRLLEKGFAYEKSGSIYFSIGRWKPYGRLSKCRQGNRQTAEVPAETEKIEREDFVLWKARKSSDGDVFWESPFGQGRPGWHTECSAMALKYLGPNFDLHCGGVDLCFPHHENEIAQSEAMAETAFARHWLHVAHLQMAGEKMSKSLGNLYTVDDLHRQGFDGSAVRYAILGGHYRRPLNFSLSALGAARSALKKLQFFENRLIELSGTDPATLPLPTHFEGFKAAWLALQDDLNIPAALGAIFGRLSQLSTATLSVKDAQEELAEWLGLKFALGLFFAPESRAPIAIPASVRRLADRRLAARNEKDFALADRLRSELKALGWSVEDRPDSYELFPVQ